MINTLDRYENLYSVTTVLYIILVFMVEPKGKHAEQCIRTGKKINHIFISSQKKLQQNAN